MIIQADKAENLDVDEILNRHKGAGGAGKAEEHKAIRFKLSRVFHDFAPYDLPPDEHQPLRQRSKSDSDLFNPVFLCCLCFDFPNFCCCFHDLNRLFRY